ncbi:MAG: hypothetical protein R3200_09930 [Xanthomonadales bacterium]|nr:hypothetical protein [Xanthomonadales bacterium]
MTVFLLSFGIFLIAIIGMAIGALAGREPIRGSCGGLGNCGHCRNQCPKRTGETDS